MGRYAEQARAFVATLPPPSDEERRAITRINHEYLMKLAVQERRTAA